MTFFSCFILEIMKFLLFNLLIIYLLILNVFSLEVKNNDKHVIQSQKDLTVAAGHHHDHDEHGHHEDHHDHGHHHDDHEKKKKLSLTGGHKGGHSSGLNSYDTKKWGMKFIN